MSKPCRRSLPPSAGLRNPFITAEHFKQLLTTRWGLGASLKLRVQAGAALRSSEGETDLQVAIPAEFIYQSCRIRVRNDKTVEGFATLKTGAATYP